MSLSHSCCDTQRHCCDRLGETYFRIVHASGLRILVCPKQMHSVSATVVVRFGAQDTRFAVGGERYRTYPEGVAHYLEHQLFTCENGGTVDEVFSSLGAEVNAWTNHERTAYIANTAAHSDEVLRTLLRFVTTPAFTDASVQKEQGIIIQEIRMVEDDPWETLHRRSMASLFAHHPTAKGICGTEKTVGRVTLQTLRDCYHAFYRPDNMCLTVCGDVTPEQVVRVVDDVLADRADAALTLRRGCVGAYDRRMPVKRRWRGDANLSKPIFRIAWRDDDFPDHPTQRLQRDVCMDVLSELVFSRAGVFYNRLTDRDLITSTYAYGYSSMMNAAYHSISGESDHPEQVLQVYFDVLAELRRTGISAQDFERNRRVVYAGFVADFDDTETIAELLGEAEEDALGAFDRLAVIEALTQEQLYRTLCDTLDERRTTLTVLMPRQQCTEQEEVNQ